MFRVYSSEYCNVSCILFRVSRMCHRRIQSVRNASFRVLFLINQPVHLVEVIHKNKDKDRSKRHNQEAGLA